MQVYFQNDKLDIFGIVGVNYNLLTKSHGNYVNATGNKYDVISLNDEASKNLLGWGILERLDQNSHTLSTPSVENLTLSDKAEMEA